MTQASNAEPQDLTPVDGGNVDTTPTQAENQGATPPPEAEKNAQPDIDKIVQKRLDRERKKWEAETQEAAKRARMDEAERLKADLADRDKRIQEAEAKAEAAERRAALTGKVADPTAALRLLDDDHINDDGSINVPALLKTYPFLAPANGPTPTRGAGGGSTPKRFTPEALKSMSAKEINAHWDAIRKDLAKP